MKVFKGRMHVTTPSGTIAYCYLDTHGMPMRYLTRNETIVDGNLSRKQSLHFLLCLIVKCSAKRELVPGISPEQNPN